MATSIRDVIRKLIRQPEPTRPAIGQVIQERAQAEAQRRLLDQAKRLRETRWYSERTQILPAVPMTLGQRTGHGTRGLG